MESEESDPETREVPSVVRTRAGNRLPDSRGRVQEPSLLGERLEEDWTYYGLSGRQRARRNGSAGLRDLYDPTPTSGSEHRDTLHERFDRRPHVRSHHYNGHVRTYHPSKDESHSHQLRAPRHHQRDPPHASGVMPTQFVSQGPYTTMAGPAFDPYRHASSGHFHTPAPSPFMPVPGYQPPMRPPPPFPRSTRAPDTVTATVPSAADTHSRPYPPSASSAEQPAAAEATYDESKPWEPQMLPPTDRELLKAQAFTEVMRTHNHNTDKEYYLR